PEPEPLPPAPVSAHRQVLTVFDRIAEAGRPDLWITLRPAEEVLVDAKAVDERVRAGDELPLAGLLVAVKDNIDVAGLPTTAGCPAYAYTPDVSAVAIQRLTAAGAVVLGKTSLEEFDGPWGLGRPCGPGAAEEVVGLGLAGVAVGTGTAGSAPASGVFGLKPTPGLVPTTGAVPTMRPYDCLTVFSPNLAEGLRALAAMTGPDAGDPLSRAWPESVRLAAGERARIAVPGAEGLAPLSGPARAGFDRIVADLLAWGAEVTPVDIMPFLVAAKLLQDGPLAAERHAAIGEFVARERTVGPAVAKAVLAAKEIPAYRLAAEQARLAEYRREAARVLDGFDALLLPAVPGQAALAGSFVNLLDLAAVAVPAGHAGGQPFGVSVITRAFDDQIALDVAAFLGGEQIRTPYPPTGIDLVVFGAHLRGQPLNGQLTALGARFRGDVLTAPRYRMVALPAVPPKPGILPAADGAAIEGERWTLSPAALGRFLAGLPGPMTLGEIELEDGSTAIGFQCAAGLAGQARDITAFGGWRAYLRHLTATRHYTLAS
ncbi:allophanate hydrolase-related protein, partial [Amycolatopsis rhizosphaerae]|uniref:allophanate hydrolase-related protein n=1 Tax=Amycolatopsis rhizosphaerae TaxID=2053003 RepID=UPI001FEC43C1